MKKRETIDQFLARQNWTPAQIDSFKSLLHDYMENVLPSDEMFNGVSKELGDELTGYIHSLGIK